MSASFRGDRSGCAADNGGDVPVCDLNLPNPSRAGGDWRESLIVGTFAFTRALLSVAPLQIQKGGNDETRFDRCRNRGCFGSGRLGRGGERTIWRSGCSLQRCPRLWPFSDVCPFSKICPSCLPPLCPCPATVWQ